MTHKKATTKRLLSFILMFSILLTMMPMFSITANAGWLDGILGIVNDIKGAASEVSGYVEKGKQYYEQAMS